MQYAKEDVVFVLRQLIRVANTNKHSFSETDARIFLKAARTILQKAAEHGDIKFNGSEKIDYIEAVITSEAQLHYCDMRHAALAATSLLRSVVSVR